MKECPTCKGKKKVEADIPIWAIPDVNNCSFLEKCKTCDGVGYISERDVHS